MAASNEVAAHIMEHLVAHDGDGGHGYSQGSNRWGNGVLETLEIDGRSYRFAGGDRDCSSGVISAFEAAGVDCGGATYTGNMRARLCGTGNFEWKPMSYTARRGDIYLTSEATLRCANRPFPICSCSSASTRTAASSAAGRATKPETSRTRDPTTTTLGTASCISSEKEARPHREPRAARYRTFATVPAHKPKAGFRKW